MYKVKYTRRAEKFLEKYPELKKFTTKAMKDIAKNIQEARSYDIKKLKGFKDIFRLRKGDYRVIFEVRENEFIIKVIEANNRGDVY